MGKVSLALGLTVIVATIFLIVLMHPSRAQLGAASVNEYGYSVGRDADTARRGFENSRGGGPSAAAAEGMGQTGSSNGASGSDDANAWGADKTEDSWNYGGADSERSGAGAEVSADKASEGEAAVAETFARSSSGASSGMPNRLPDTGGPGAASLFWGVIALLALGPGARVFHSAARGADH